VLDLRTFGGLWLENRASLAPIAVQRSRLALLAILAVAGPAGLSRDRVAALLWPESNTERARGALRQALYAFRREPGCGDLIRGVSDLRLNPNTIRSDVADFERCLAEGQLEEAVELHRGVFLDGFWLRDNAEFEHWVDTERDRIDGLYARALESLAESARSEGDREAAIQWWRRRAETDRLNDRVALAYMQALIEHGERSRALEHALSHSARVRAELELEPDAEIGLLVGRLRSGGTTTSDHRPVNARAVSAHDRVSGRPAGSKTRPEFARRPRVRRGRVVRLAGTVASARGLIAVAPRVWSAVHHREPGNSYGWQFPVGLPDSARLREEVVGMTLALSPDASTLAFVGGSDRSRLYLRTMREPKPHALVGTEGAVTPQFSPDGHWLAFLVRSQLRRLALPDGPITVIADSVSSYSWGDRGFIVFSRILWGNAGRSTVGLWTVDTSGSNLTPLTTVDTSSGERAHSWPFVLPGSQVVLFQVQTSTPDQSELAAVRLSDKRVHHLGVVGCAPRLTGDDIIVFARFGRGRYGSSVYAAQFDQRALRITSTPRAIRNDIVVKTDCGTELAVASNGTAAYVRSDGARDLLIVRRDGTTRQINDQREAFSTPRFSPNGQHVAVVVHDSTDRDVFVVNTSTRSRLRLSVNGMGFNPQWSRDGRYVIWQESRSMGDDKRIWRRPWDGSAPAELLGTAPQRVVGTFLVGPDARPAVVTFDSALGLPVSKPGTTRPIMARLSSDGRWIAYVSNETQMREVYVQQYGLPHVTSQRLTTDGGTEPAWDGAGRLYYRTHGKIVQSAFRSTEGAGRDMRPDPVLEDSYWSMTSGTSADFDVSLDGNSFIVVKAAEHAVDPVVLLNWVGTWRNQLGSRSDRPHGTPP
jgi:DNA-binding SARP family transcriptional activator